MIFKSPRSAEKPGYRSILADCGLLAGLETLLCAALRQQTAPGSLHFDFQVPQGAEKPGCRSILAFLVPLAGLEPARCCHLGILSFARQLEADGQN